jgi:NADP-dependent 3-hydroxy acid dehydrogenase YdfG
VLAVARSAATIDALDVPGVTGRVADLGEPGVAREVLEAAGDVDLVVNAIADPGVSDAALSMHDGEQHDLESRIGDAVTPVHNVIDATLAHLCAQGSGTFVQITGGLALRARPGTGALSATAHATRAHVEAAIPAARERGGHVALLVVTGLIESDLTAGALDGAPPRASMTGADVVAAIGFLLGQTGARAWTHELNLIPPAMAWSP